MIRAAQRVEEGSEATALNADRDALKFSNETRRCDEFVRCSFVPF